MLGYNNSFEKKKKKRGDVTIYCDTPCVRDLGALFGHLINQPIFTHFDGLLHVETAVHAQLF